MNEVTIKAASYLTPEGYGSSHIGHQAWPTNEDGSHVCTDPMSISWSSLFPSPCARLGSKDALSRLGLMAVELLAAGFADMTDAQRTEVGICMVTPTGSIATDIQFLGDLSPSTFIYTLPSGVIGEVCIRHGLRGPSLCLMSGADIGRSIIAEAAERIAMGEAEAMICLACEARNPATEDILNSALDKDSDFCWYVNGLYLTGKAMDDGTGRAVSPHMAAAGIRRVCQELCERE